MFALAFMFASNVSAQSGQLIFKEGQNGDQNTVVHITDAPGQWYNLKDKTPVNVGANDEIRSVILQNVRAGATITVYDRPNGTPGDDWCVIEVKQFVPYLIIPGFETSWENEYVRCTTYNDDNDLDGKVSFIRVN